MSPLSTAKMSHAHKDDLHVGPYRLEKTLGKGQTGEYFGVFLFDTGVHVFARALVLTLVHALIRARVFIFLCVFLFLYVSLLVYLFFLL